MHTFDPQSLFSDAQLRALINDDKRGDTIKGILALIGVCVAIAFLVFATAQLAGGGVFVINP